MAKKSKAATTSIVLATTSSAKRAKSGNASNAVVLATTSSAKHAKAVSASSSILLTQSTNKLQSKKILSESLLTLLGAAEVQTARHVDSLTLLGVTDHAIGRLEKTVFGISTLSMTSTASSNKVSSPQVVTELLVEQDASGIRKVDVIPLPFNRVITLVGVHEGSQNASALIHALLHYAGHPVSPMSGYTSPCDEVLAMLKKSGVSENALHILREYMESARENYARRY